MRNRERSHRMPAFNFEVGLAQGYWFALGSLLLTRLSPASDRYRLRFRILNTTCFAECLRLLAKRRVAHGVIDDGFYVSRKGWAGHAVGCKELAALRRIVALLQEKVGHATMGQTT